MDLPAKPVEENLSLVVDRPKKLIYSLLNDLKWNLKEEVDRKSKNQLNANFWDDSIRLVSRRRSYQRNFYIGPISIRLYFQIRNKSKYDWCTIISSTKTTKNSIHLAMIRRELQSENNDPSKLSAWKKQINLISQV